MGIKIKFYPLHKIKLLQLLIIVAILSTASSASAQYFYKDIWNTSQLNKESIKLKNESIKLIQTKSFEDDGTPSEGFFCEKRIDKEFTSATMASNSYITGQSLILTYYKENGQVLKVIDSSSSSVNITDYQYDHSRVKSISTTTRSKEDNIGIIEIHDYFYTASGQLEKMQRKKMGALIGTVNFLTDKNGNVIEEQEVLKNVTGRKYFYYYDEKNRLTDVVHNNERANRLLPDYVYEYDNKGNINQLISTDENSSNYFIWKYDYDDKNFRISEKCFSKEKRLLGSIVYHYQ